MFASYHDLLLSFYARSKAFTDKERLEIIDNLGGLDKIVELCLTNKSYCETNINENKGEHLNNIFLDYNHRRDNRIDKITKVDTEDDDFDTRNANTIDRKKITFGENPNGSGITEYEECELIYFVTIENCFYFKYLSQKKAIFIMQKILSNKWYSFIMLLLAGIFGFIYILNSFSFILDNSKFLESIDSKFEFSNWAICSCFVLIVYSLSFLLTVNIDILKLIVSRFEFWFKLYNLAIFLVFLFWITILRLQLTIDELETKQAKQERLRYYIFFIMIQFLTFVIAMISLLLMDGLYIPAKTKYIIMVMASGACFVTTFTWMFEADSTSPMYNVNIDITGGMFEDVLNINLRSGIISSSSNLGIFLIKPVLSWLFEKIKSVCINIANKINKIKNGENESKFTVNRQISTFLQENNDPFMHMKFTRSSVYKKPTLVWKQGSIMNEFDQELQLGEYIKIKEDS